jgi:hypothetical protein
MSFPPAPMTVTELLLGTEIPATPPPEVLDAIGRAAAAWEQLDASGRHVQFDLDQLTGKLSAELADSDGYLLSLAPHQVLELATGVTLY